MATIAAIDGCMIKRNAIGPLGRASRLFQMRSTFSMVTPRQTAPAIISKMPSVTTTFAKSPNCARMSVISGTPPTHRLACTGAAPNLLTAIFAVKRIMSPSGSTTTDSWPLGRVRYSPDRLPKCCSAANVKRAKSRLMQCSKYHPRWITPAAGTIGRTNWSNAPFLLSGAAVSSPP
jgi:hypothetical protein